MAHIANSKQPGRTDKHYHFQSATTFTFNGLTQLIAIKGAG
jgi:hypothetical protein